MVEIRHTTKYLKEYQIARKYYHLRKIASTTEDVCPLYPLFVFPDRDNEQFKKFERQIMSAQKSNDSDSM